MAEQAVNPLSCPARVDSSSEPVMQEDGHMCTSPRLDATEYQCAICCELLLDPVVGSCGHDFCKRCINAWKLSCDKYGRRVQCPLCREDLLSGPSQTFGVCIRLRETIERLFPEQIAARRRQATIDQAQESVHGAAHTRGTDDLPASFTLFAETYRQLSEHLLSLVTPAEPAALHHAHQLQLLRHQANLQSSLELLQRPSAPTSSSTSTSSSSTTTAQHTAWRRGETSGPLPHVGPVQPSGHQQQHAQAYHPGPADVSGHSDPWAVLWEQWAAAVREHNDQWAAAIMQVLVQTSSAAQQLQHQPTPGPAAAGAAAVTTPRPAASPRSTQEQRAINNSWMCPGTLGSESDLLHMHNKLQGRLQACERLMELCGVPLDAAAPGASNTRAPQQAAATVYHQQGQGPAAGTWGMGEVPCGALYPYPGMANTEDWRRLHQQQQQQAAAAQLLQHQQLQAVTQQPHLTMLAPTPPGAAYWQQHHQQQQFLQQQHQLMCGARFH